MKWQYIASGVVGAIAVFGIVAVASDNFGDDASPECRDVIVETQQPVRDEDQITGTIVGAVVGGAIGNQVGDGSGKDIATAAGAVAGGAAGKNVQKDMQEKNVRQEVQRVCE